MSSRCGVGRLVGGCGWVVCVVFVCVRMCVYVVGGGVEGAVER